MLYPRDENDDTQDIVDLGEDREEDKGKILIDSMANVDSCDFLVVNVTNAIDHRCSVIKINDTVDANGNTPGSIDQRREKELILQISPTKNEYIYLNFDNSIWSRKIIFHSSSESHSMLGITKNNLLHKVHLFSSHADCGGESR